MSAFYLSNKLTSVSSQNTVSFPIKCIYYKGHVFMFLLSFFFFVFLFHALIFMHYIKFRFDMSLLSYCMYSVGLHVFVLMLLFCIKLVFITRLHKVTCNVLNF